MAIEDKKIPHITMDWVRRHFDYHLDGYLLNKVKRKGAHRGVGQRTCINTPKSYRQLTIDGYNTREHRVIWMWHNGHWPDLVDHIDGDILNNRIENLREVNHTSNIRHQPHHKHIRGVWFNQTHNLYEVFIYFENKKIHLGRVECVEDAKKLRKEGEIKYWGKIYQDKLKDI